MIIHSFKCPNASINFDNFGNTDNIKTIADTIEFARINNDETVVDFLNFITKE